MDWHNRILVNSRNWLSVHRACLHSPSFSTFRSKHGKVKWLNLKPCSEGCDIVGILVTFCLFFQSPKQYLPSTLPDLGRTFWSMIQNLAFQEFWIPLLSFRTFLLRKSILPVYVINTLFYLTGHHRLVCTSHQMVSDDASTAICWIRFNSSC